MRTLVTGLALLACAVGLSTSAALAATTGDKTEPWLEGAVGPTYDRVGGPPRAMGLTVRLGFNSLDPTQLPATLARAELKFTRGAVVNGAWFPKCNPARLRAHKSCPKASFLGRAQIGAAIGPSVSEMMNVPLIADLYNGPRGKSIVFHFKGSVPVPINVVQDAPLTKINERFYAWRLVVDVPEILQLPLVGVPSSVLDFEVTVKGTVKHKGKRRGYIETSLCPPGAQVPMIGNFTFRDKIVGTKKSTIVCGGELP
jgi:hypothetical protein